MITRATACLVTLVAALAPPMSAAARAAASPGGEPFEFSSPAAVTKGAELRGRIVETRDGEELGRVQDFALDLSSGRIAYVVVSVGSFLIEDSLIAVAPGALRESADADGRLVLETDASSLRDAGRFSERGNWPVQADVLAAAGDPAPASDEAAAPQEERAQRGTATISDGNRTATLSAGERSIRFESAPGDGNAKSAPGDRSHSERNPGEPASRFERLDNDGDGVLDRAEIAHELNRSDSFTTIDRDGSGEIDPEEFDALLERRQAPEEDEAPSR